MFFLLTQWPLVAIQLKYYYNLECSQPHLWFVFPLFSRSFQTISESGELGHALLIIDNN
ncbi:hypothetical protein MtrunA17_Chr4g0042461 [Medicago truncatula]|uniref:Uncharacterized protein n=1 Tax=Medicago truncatula TaxID=3880 RepID=A0A396IB45_MEDTR|nr:hypothetical protein MtrunA17_Chr4g0042461 [Medicago truncatula]